MWTKHRKLIILLIFAAVVVGIGAYTWFTNRSARKIASKFEQEKRLDNSHPDLPTSSIGVATKTSAAVQTAASTPLLNFKHWIADVVGDSSEVAKLRGKISQLQEDKTRLIGVLQENERLRGLLKVKAERPELEMVWGKVIASDVTPYFRVLRLRLHLAQSERVKPMMPVIVQSGVVGIISRIEGNYAEVMILSDPRSRVDVVSQRNRARGMVEGLGHSSDYLAKVAYLKQEDEVRVGDLFVTSGKGGIFPQNLQVGRVVSVKTSQLGLFQEVEVEPSVDFSRLEEVFVIVGDIEPKIEPYTMPSTPKVAEEDGEEGGAPGAAAPTNNRRPEVP